MRLMVERLLDQVAEPFTNSPAENKTCFGEPPKWNKIYLSLPRYIKFGGTFWRHFLAALFGSTFHWPHFLLAALFIGRTFHWRHFLAALFIVGSFFWRHFFLEALFLQHFSVALFLLPDFSCWSFWTRCFRQ